MYCDDGCWVFCIAICNIAGVMRGEIFENANVGIRFVYTVELTLLSRVFDIRCNHQLKSFSVFQLVG